MRVIVEESYEGFLVVERRVIVLDRQDNFGSCEENGRRRRYREQVNLEVGKLVRKLLQELKNNNKGLFRFIKVKVVKDLIVVGYFKSGGVDGIKIFLRVGIVSLCGIMCIQIGMVRYC